MEHEFGLVEFVRIFLFALTLEIYTITWYVFPLSSVDIILGLSWLALLGDIRAKLEHSHHGISIEGRQQCLHRDPTLACGIHELQLLESENESWLLWSLEGVNMTQLGISEALSAAAQSDLAAVITTQQSALIQGVFLQLMQLTTELYFSQAPACLCSPLPIQPFVER